MEQADDGTGQTSAVLVNLLTMDITVDQIVADGVAIIQNDLHNFKVGTIVGKDEGILFIGNRPIRRCGFHG